MTNTASGTLIFKAGGQATKVRWLSTVLIVVGIGCMVAAYPIFTSATGAGGVPASLAERIGLAIMMVTLGGLCIVGMLVFLSVYLVEMRTHGDHVELQLFRPLYGKRTLQLPLNALQRGKHHAGRYGFVEHSGRRYRYDVQQVEAPWRSVRVEGWLLPLVVDLQGSEINAAKLQRLFAGDDEQRHG